MSNKPITIYFSSRLDNDYSFLSNFHNAPLLIDGKVWSTNEHFFQAQKTADMADQERLRQCAKPSQAKHLGRRVKLRKDWETVKVDIMRHVCREKFDQHPELREKLLSTGSAVLAERSSRDKFWADAGNGSGRNMLGKIIMQIRDEFRNSSDLPGHVVV